VVFGGEGFIMQKIEGDGLAFVHSGGTMAKKELKAGEVLKVDGCIIGFTKDVDYDIEFIGGIKNSILVVKDYFTLHFAVGTVYVQSLPSVDWPIESHQHQELVETAAAKEVYCGLGNLLDGDNRF
jgi:uncharacterized protein (AIM24 family)